MQLEPKCTYIQVARVPRLIHELQGWLLKKKLMRAQRKTYMSKVKCHAKAGHHAETGRCAKGRMREEGR